MDLPYDPRPGQTRFMELIHEAQRDHGHAIIEAPTGIGKTVAAVAASLEVPDGDSVLYLTRTNSQQAQVVQEHAALRAAGNDVGLLVPFMGRRQYCPLLRHDPKFSDGTPEELGRLCRDAKAKAMQAHATGADVPGMCPFYLRLLEDGTGPVEALLHEGLAPDALAARISGCGSCPYEALKSLLNRARIVTAPYVFGIEAGLRDAMFGWMGVRADQVHVLIDEAHNLPAAVRDHHSPRLGRHALKRAIKEAGDHQDPVLAGHLLTTTLLHALDQALEALATEFVHGDDGRLPPDALQETLLESLRIPSTRLARAIQDLLAWGDVIREAKREQGRLPRSYLGSVAAFLDHWCRQDGEYAHLVNGGDDPAVEALLLDPATALDWLDHVASSVHFSGTLQPTNDHRAACGLPATTTEEAIASPFPAEHLTVLGLHGVHRRWQAHEEDPRHTADQQEACRRVLAKRAGKTALFFPSFRMLAAWEEEGFFHGIPGRLHRDEPGSSAAQTLRLIGSFRQDPDPDALLLAVLGGRISEGIDFPGDMLEQVIILGVPYPRPTARQQALVDHADRRHGNGWRLAVHNPVGRSLRQAVGRLIRGPDDRGTAVVLDERIVRFSDHLPRLRMADSLDDLLAGGPDEQTGAFQPATEVARPDPT